MSEAGAAVPAQASGKDFAPARSVSETRLLKLSLAGTLVVAAGGILCGLLSGSMAILFEGLFSLIDAVITATALHVARLVAREADRRFQFGYWHFEPLVLALNGCVLTLLCVYAFFNAVSGLITGGHEVEFDIAFIYTGTISILCVGMYLYQRNGNRVARSEFVRLDMHGWLISAAITGALLIAFSAAVAVRGTGLDHLIPLVDPAVLALLAPLLMLGPMNAARRAFRDIFLMAPRDLDAAVRSAMDDVVRRRGFAGYSSYIAKVGRADFVEIYVVLPPAYPLVAIETLDELRREIESALGGEDKDRWLTIMFTADAEAAGAATLSG